MNEKVLMFWKYFEWGQFYCKKFNRMIDIHNDNVKIIVENCKMKIIHENFEMYPEELQIILREINELTKKENNYSQQMLEEFEEMLDTSISCKLIDYLRSIGIRVDDIPKERYINPKELK